MQSVHGVAMAVGFASFFLLWAATVWGLVLRNGWASTRLRYSSIEGAHTTLALLGLTLGLVHAAAQLAVPDGPVRLVDEVVPFINPNDPVGMGAAVLSLELFAASALSALIRRRLGHARWHAVHTLSYAAFLLLSAHVLISGSDMGPMWVWVSVLVACGIVVVLWLTTTRWSKRLRSRMLERSVVRGQAQALTVDVDARKCQRFGFCEHEAPDVFRLQGDGRLAYHSSVPAAAAEGVIRAVEVCPARAIALRRLPTTTVLTTTGDTGGLRAVPSEPPFSSSQLPGPDGEPRPHSVSGDGLRRRSRVGAGQQRRGKTW